MFPIQTAFSLTSRHFPLVTHSEIAKHVDDVGFPPRQPLRTDTGGKLFENSAKDRIGLRILG